MAANPPINILAACIIVAGLQTIGDGPAYADTLHVPGEYATIQDALWAAHHGDEIVVADGSYNGPGFYDLDFAGLLITLRSASGDPNLCTLDCQMMGRAFTFGNDETAEAIIEGFTITNAVAVEGGAFHITDAGPTIRDCVILDCYGDIYGGGAYINGGLPSFTNCTFRGCFAINAGGAVFAYGGGELQLSDCTFEDNDTFGLGGAIYVENATLNLSGGTFDQNEAMGDGGAIATETALLTATNTQFTTNHADGLGGALLNSVGNATLTGCTFESNDGGSADEGGGAVYHTEGELRLTACTFESNTAQLFGGALYAEDGTADLENCSFHGNSTTLGLDEVEGGGAIANTHYNSLTMSGCTLTQNISAHDGGAVLNLDGATADLSQCVFESNQADDSVGYGGAICGHSAAEAQITDCTFAGNQAYNGGAVFGILSDSITTIDRCRFEQNDAGSGRGGAVWAGAAEILIVGSIFVDNTAGAGGAIYFLPVSPANTVVNCRFHGNTATWKGGAIATSEDVTVVNCLFTANEGPGGAVFLETSSHVVLINCTLWANDAWGVSMEYYEPTIELDVRNCIFRGNVPGQIDPQSPWHITVSYSDIEDGWEGEGNIDADPWFADPDGLDNIPGTEDDDLRLLTGSPCIDAGDSTAVPFYIVTDLDGNPRIIDDPDTADTGIGYPCLDMGAYEYPACKEDINRDGVVDIDDLFEVLAHWNEGAGIYDVNSDSLVNIDDIFAVLAGWGPCP